MCIQTPGSFVWAGSLAARLGREGWSTWGIYLVTGCLQGVLLGMGIYYEVLDRRRRKDEEVSAQVGDAVPHRSSTEDERRGSAGLESGPVDHERTPLLRNGK